MDGELEQLGERIAEQAAHLDAAIHRLLTDLREFDARGGWHIQGAVTCAQWLAWRVGWDRVTARDHVRVARKLAEFAQIDDALRLAREAAAAATMPGATAHPDSAESARAADAESSQATADSAESPAPAAPSRAAASPPTGTSDSAESARAADVEPSQATSDPAELPAPAAPCCTAAGISAGSLVAGGTAWTGVATVRCTAEEPITWTGATQAGDSAACCEVAGRSLLDRLLDDAEALRSGEPIAAGAAAELRDLPAPAPSQHEAERRKEQPAQRTSALRDRAAAARKAFNRADALVELAQGYLRGDRPDRSPIEVTLTVPVSLLRDEVADPVEVGELGESFLSRDAARRLSCDAGVVEILEDGQGVPLSVGRKQRTIAGALRRALHRRDRSCTYPGCSNRLFLEGHHIRHWADGGETSLSNALLLCSLHHRRVHELGFTVELGPDQRPRFRDPRGRLVAAVPQPPAPPDLGWPRILAANEPLAIDASTIAGPWDGTPVDYARIVGHLATADGLT
ncbi:MAG TPA: DUF222 domain-containing protein [Kofleriaceae bacterium]|jgi:hypothetical protein|nr:DUF222 domain-containing protein [Kofleriaceae bacterium]